MAEEKQKVLIVDDDEFLLDMYVMKFKDSGFDVEIAKSGEEAVQKLKDGFAADAVLLDIVMPNMDGLEALKTIKKEKLAPSSKCIILSNLGQKEDIDKGVAAGADDYIIKAHFTPTEVVDKVKGLIERKSG